MTRPLQERLRSGQDIPELGPRDRIERLTANRAKIDQPALAQAREMSGYRRLRKSQLCDEIDHASLPPGKALHDGEPGGVGQSPEESGGGGQRISLTGRDSINRHKTILSLFADDSSEPGAESPPPSSGQSIVDLIPDGELSCLDSSEQ